MTISQLKRIIIPTPGQVLTTIVLSLFLFGLTFKDLIVRQFFGRGVVDLEPYLQQSYQSQLSRFSALPVVDLVVKAVFWAGVGLIAYLIFLAISNAIIEARNEAVVETAYTNKGLLLQRLRQPLVQLLLALFLIGAVLASVIWLLPFWLGLFANALLGAPAPVSLIGLLGSIVGVSFNIYVLWMLGQIVFAID